MIRKLFIIAAILGITAASTWAQETARQQIFIYANIPDISEGASSEESLGRYANEAHKDEITVLGFNEKITQNVTFNWQHRAYDIGMYEIYPITFLKHIDKTTPLLERKHFYQGLLYSITFSFYRLNQDSGELELVMTKKFQDCYITNIDKIVLNQGEHAHLDLPMMEKVTFIFERVTTTHNKTGTQSTTDAINRY